MRVFSNHVFLLQYNMDCSIEYVKWVQYFKQNRHFSKYFEWIIFFAEFKRRELYKKLQEMKMKIMMITSLAFLLIIFNVNAQLNCELPEPLKPIWQEVAQVSFLV